MKCQVKTPIRQSQLRRRLVLLIGRILQQQSERIPVGNNGAGADVALADQVLGKEVLEQLAELRASARGAHGRLSFAANCSNF